MPSGQLSNSTPATAVPPSAYATMSAIPSSFSQRCSYACAGISCTTQFFFYGPSRELRGGLAVYDVRGSVIAGGRAARWGPDRPFTRLASVRTRFRAACSDRRTSIAVIAMLVIMCNVYVISDDCVHARSTRQSTFQTKKLPLPKRKCSNFEIEGLLAHFDPDAARLGGNGACSSQM